MALNMLAAAATGNKQNLADLDQRDCIA